MTAARDVGMTFLSQDSGRDLRCSVSLAFPAQNDLRYCKDRSIGDFQELHINRLIGLGSSTSSIHI
jgi:hypothetical protein